MKDNYLGYIFCKKSHYNVQFTTEVSYLQHFFFILDCIPRAESFSDANHQSQERTSLQVAGGTFVRKNHLFFLESPVFTDPQLLGTGEKGSKMCMRNED